MLKPTTFQEYKDAYEHSKAICDLKERAIQQLERSLLTKDILIQSLKNMLAKYTDAFTK
jgi:hypothetical protein